MKELQLNYYFENISEFAEKEIFEGCKYVWEPLNRTKEYLQKKIVQPNIKINKAEMGEYCVVKGNYYIDEGTKIGSNVCIEGPVIIGKNVSIASGALIRPGTIIGDNASVGHGSEVKNAIIQNKAKIASLAFVGDSILGKSARIGSGTILANRRFDQKNIEIKVDGQKHNTGTDFFGSIIGDSTRLGANCTAVPGTCIGPYTWILPTVQVRGFIPTEKRILPKAEYIIQENPRVELK